MDDRALTALLRQPATRTLFWSKVVRDPVTGCWTYTGGTDDDGYGRFSIGRSTVKAHVASYLIQYGVRPPGVESDHSCRNKRCVKYAPGHVEMVPHVVNVRRYASTITHCPHGHAYTEENTLYVQYPTGPARRCRTCKRERERRHRP